MAAYVAQAGRAEKGIDDRMPEDIPVGVPRFALVVGYLLSGQQKPASRDQGVYIPSFAYPERGSFEPAIPRSSG
jgi:hypothetical protein